MVCAVGGFDTASSAMGGETANLIRFLDLEDIARTRLHSIHKADGNTEPWRYLLGITKDDTLRLCHGYLHRIRRGVSPVSPSFAAWRPLAGRS